MDDISCGILIKKINNLLARDADNSLREKNLTFLQIHSLMILKKKNQDMCLKELEHILKVSQPDAAGIVIRLEKKGLIQSYTDALDKRIKRIMITELGLKCCQEAKQHMDEIDEVLLKGMTSNEQSQFKELLCRTLNNLVNKEENHD